MLLDQLCNPSFSTRRHAESKWGSGQCRLGERRRSEKVVNNSPLSAVLQQDVKIHQVNPFELYCNGWPIIVQQDVTTSRRTCCSLRATGCEFLWRTCCFWEIATGLVSTSSSVNLARNCTNVWTDWIVLYIVYMVCIMSIELNVEVRTTLLKQFGTTVEFSPSWNSFLNTIVKNYYIHIFSLQLHALMATLGLESCSSKVWPSYSCVNQHFLFCLSKWMNICRGE